MIRRTVPGRITLFLILPLLTMFFLTLRPRSAGGDEPMPLPTDARQRLADGLLLSAEEIDLSGLSVPVGSLGALFSSVMNDTPELFHVAPRLSYAYDGNGYVLSVTPDFTLTGDELTAARRLYLETLNDFCESLDTVRQEASPNGEAWCDADTVLYLHEWMIGRFDYDADPAADGRSSQNFDAYRLFRDGRGVCQAYALAFLALARAAGLEAAVVTSDAMDHAWNLVRVDGAWYHVDVTRDDPIRPDGTPGITGHSRFLLSDAALTALGYTGYVLPAGVSCADTRCEAPDGRALLADVRTPIIRLPRGWYAVETDVLPTPVVLPNIPSPLGIPGDLDRDGCLSPADLLLLRACADRLPDSESALTRLRRALLDGM